MKDVDVLPPLFQRLVDPDFMLSEQISTILSNLAREEKTCETVFKVKRVSGSGRVGAAFPVLTALGSSVTATPAGE